MLVSREISMLILFPSWNLPAYCDDPLLLSPAIAQTRYTQCHKWRRHISTFPLSSQLSHFYIFSVGIGSLTPYILSTFRLRLQDQSRLQLS